MSPKGTLQSAGRAGYCVEKDLREASGIKGELGDFALPCAGGVGNAAWGRVGGAGAGRGTKGNVTCILMAETLALAHRHDV